MRIRTTGVLAAALAVAALALTGCTADDPEESQVSQPPLIFGSPPAGTSPTAEPSRPAPEGSFGSRPTAPRVTPSVSVSTRLCDPDSKVAKFCVSAEQVPLNDPIDPSAPCGDLMSGRYGGKLYLCVKDQWVRTNIAAPSR
jgi:hypothetical protein